MTEKEIDLKVQEYYNALGRAIIDLDFVTMHRCFFAMKALLKKRQFLIK